jgi:hypothetical protein
MASKPKSTDVPALPLNDILLPLRDALREASGQRNLAMNPVDQTTGSKTLYALTGPGTINARTDRICKLNQLFPKTKPELWLGILLELRKRTREAPTAEDNYEVSHVSIQAFAGATSQTIEPLLRAEWDPGIARGRNGPAQPHWHAYATRLNGEPGFVDAGYEQFEKPTPTFGALKQRKHKIHFALCADWHKEGGSEFQILRTPEELKSWVVGAVEYIKSQA